MAAITLALLFGLFDLIFGIWMVVQGSSCAVPAALDSGRPGKAAGLS